MTKIFKNIFIQGNKKDTQKIMNNKMIKLNMKIIKNKILKIKINMTLVLKQNLINNMRIKMRNNNKQSYNKIKINKMIIQNIKKRI